MENDQRFLAADGRKYSGLERGDLSPKDFQDYTFVQLADTQLGMMTQMKEVQHLLYLRTLIKIFTLGFKDGKKEIPIPELSAIHRGQTGEDLFEIEVELSRQAVHCINKMSPKPVFAVICGDLVHAFPDKDPKKNAMEVEAFKNIYAKIDPSIRLVCLCGNHDVSEKPSAKELGLWKERFGDDYFSFWVGSDKYIVLNSQMYKNDTNCKQEAEHQNEWLDKELQQGQENRRFTAVFSHIPPFINDPEESSGYFPLSKEVRLDILARLAEGDVSHWFCGHYHRNAEGTFKSSNGKQIEVITSGAVGGNIETDPAGDVLGLSGMKSIKADASVSGLRIVSVSKKGITHEFKTFESLMTEE
mmetsp:Transcript_15993/g.19842  ORF Transcript_15993/g.19842 Transcript_15993/m.19842 type:complete len:358 (-) Transcript_15993:88-1161(-)|eukprot:CAMPEP_0204850358 /NCGR_PEP_ID=MMETSP1347-20130617/7998_1 /ASSEMBLY_ACC=CAM_ASM_000690 /TAXON_ID=215587 /ORGANISM="Aplanochytrium stocchinoi, Strain GSBS06" /LENGTH=357 /DNA_ID=CAMNT_0051993307 /DNA_START=58 /DNA_END=1131 /DNA_ORIENTATION=+